MRIFRTLGGMAARGVGRVAGLAILAFPLAAVAQMLPGRLVGQLPFERSLRGSERPVEMSSQAVSADGRRVLFRTIARNLDAGVAQNASQGLYLFDRGSDRLVRITAAVPQSEWFGYPSYSLPVISGDGEWVFFTASHPLDLPPGWDYGTIWHQGYRYRISDGRMERLTALGQDSFPEIVGASHNGRHVLSLTQSMPSDGPEGSRGVRDLYLRIDLVTGRVQELKLDTQHWETMPGTVRLSPNGRWACLASESDAVLFVWDLDSDARPERADLSPAGVPGLAGALRCAVSDDGDTVSFLSRSSNLLPLPVRDGERYVFVRKRSTGHLVAVRPQSPPPPYARMYDGFIDLWMDARGETVLAGMRMGYRGTMRIFRTGPDGVLHDTEREFRTDVPFSLGAGGDWFVTTAPGQPGELLGDSRQAFVYPVNDGEPVLASFVSRHLPLPHLYQSALSMCKAQSAASADGRFVVFLSSDRRVYDSAGASSNNQVLVRDMQSDRIELISADASGQPGRIHASDATISANGRYVAFTSSRAWPEAIWDGQTRVFLHDRETGLTRMLDGRIETPDRVLDAMERASASCPVINADGSRVAFTVGGMRERAGEAVGVSEAVLWRAGHEGLLRISHSDTASDFGASGNPSISADGRRIAFISWTDDLVVDDPNPGSDVFVWEALDGSVRRLDPMQHARFDVETVRLSGDGRTVAVEVRSQPSQETPGALPTHDVFAMDVDSEAVDWLTALPPPADGGPRLRTSAVLDSLSHDGRLVLLNSVQHNLWAPSAWPDGRWNSFVLDRVTRIATPLHSGGRVDLAADGASIVLRPFEPDMTRLMQYGPLPLRTTLWWDPSESGWGLVTMDQRSAIAPALYTNDEHGRPTWFLVPGLTPVGDGSLTGPLLRFRGPGFFGAGDAAVSSSVAGELRLQFRSADEAQLDYRIGPVQHSRRLQRFVLPQEIVCAASIDPDRSALRNYTDAWWGGPSEDGWGLQVMHAGDTLYLGWYTYDDDGRAVFMIANAVHTGGQRFEGDLLRGRDGTPLSQFGGHPISSGVDAVGRIVLTFSDGESGTLQVERDGQSRTVPIQRNRFGSTASRCSSLPRP